MRKTHTAALLLAVVLLAACGEDASTRATGDNPTSIASQVTAETTTSPDWTGATIPDGTYAKTATMADAKKLGMPKDTAIEILGEDGEVHFQLRIESDNWAQFQADDVDAAAMTQGDGGSATYDAQGHWVPTSTGCGCTATVKWSFEDGRLTLKLLDTTEAGDPVDLLIGRLVMEGEWSAA